MHDNKTKYTFIKFDLGHTIYDKDSLHMHGAVLCVVPNVNHFEVDKNLLKKLETYCQNWALTTGICEKDHKILQANLALAAIRVLDKAPLETLKHYTAFVILYLLLDDVLDESWRSFNHENELSYYLNSFLDLLKGKKNDIKQIKNDALFPKFSQFCEAFIKLRQTIVNYHGHNFFIDRMEELFSYYLKEFIYRKYNKPLSLNEYLQTRIVVGGSRPHCELVYLLENIHITETMRNNEDFIKLQYLSDKIIILANDIFSLLNDTNRYGNYDNYLLLQYQMTNKPLQKVFNETLYKCNQEILNFIHCQQTFLNENSFDPIEFIHINKAIHLFLGQIQSHLEWALNTKRYRKNNVKIKTCSRTQLSSRDKDLLFGKGCNF